MYMLYLPIAGQGMRRMSQVGPNMEFVSTQYIRFKYMAASAPWAPMLIAETIFVEHRLVGLKMNCGARSKLISALSTDKLIVPMTSMLP